MKKLGILLLAAAFAVFGLMTFAACNEETPDPGDDPIVTPEPDDPDDPGKPEEPDDTDELTFEYEGAVVSLDWYDQDNEILYIEDLYDFNGIGYLSNTQGIQFRNKTIVLLADLCFNEKWIPISDFYGIFDGNHKIITGFNISSDAYMPESHPNSEYGYYQTAIFENNYGTIYNLLIKDFYIDVKLNNFFGSIQVSVLTANNYGSILNCNLTGTIFCSTNLFIVGSAEGVSTFFNANYGYINNCSVTCEMNVATTDNAGLYAVFGNNNYGRLENCNSYGTVRYNNEQNGRNNQISGLLNTSMHSEASDIFYNLYNETYADEYGEMGLYSCNSYADIESESYNRDEISGIVSSSTCIIEQCSYYGEMNISANDDNVLIDGLIGGIAARINNSKYTNSIITDNTMSGRIKLTVNNIFDIGDPRILAVGGIIGEIQTAREKTVIDNNTFSGSIKITDNTSSNSNSDPNNEHVFYYVAGIVGNANLHWSYENPPSHTKIMNCHMTGTIEVKTQHVSAIGGIAAHMYRSNELEGTVGNDFTLEVSSCSFNGHIAVQNCGPAIITAGGIAGQIESVNIINSYAKGKFDIDNSNGTFFGTIVGQSSRNPFFENGYTVSELINCDGHIQATINGINNDFSNLFGYSAWSYLKNDKIGDELANKYYYGTLDLSRKALYEELYTWFIEIGRYPYADFTFAPLVGPIDYGKYNLSIEDFQEVFVMVQLDNPKFYYTKTLFYTYESNGKPIPYAEPEIWDRYFTQDISSDNAKLLNILESVAEKTSSFSEYEKVKYIYEYINANTIYAESDGYSSSIIGTLLNGVAVCQGYSLSFKYLCDYIGIDCVVVVSDEMDHAWNIVEVDGAWYYVDTTWADTGTKDYFLLGSTEFNTDHYTYNDYLKIPEVSTTNYNLT